MKFSNTLVYWYLQHKRDLPWRNTTNPYKIWLSEIILQQTRVVQGLSYYLKFVEKFPSIFDLAKADENEILNLWQGLGYYSRARNLHFTAKHIVEKLNGKFPTSYSELLKLKGVGDYTASAIASICFEEASAVVDGNVYRVLARYFGIDIPINSTLGKKEFKTLAQELINKEDPATHNQAIMEFGARMCVPQNPNCETCPLKDSCSALQNRKIQHLPIKLKKLTIKKRYFNYMVIISSDKKTVLNKRIGKGIWQNLFEFPLIETEKSIDENEFKKRIKTKKYFINSYEKIQLFNKKDIVHKLSHQHIFTKFWIIKLDFEKEANTYWDSIDEFPVPILIHNFMEDLKQTDIFSTFEL